MQRMFLKILPAVMFLNLAAFAQQQSLADIARENKEKQAAQDAASATKPKVITNQDLGEPPEGRPDLRTPPHNWNADRPADRRWAQPGQSDQRSEQWKSRIADQESRIANLQSRLDQINASMRSNPQGAYSRSQSFQQERAAQLQSQIDEQKAKLDAMQDAARRAGMNNQLYGQ